MGVGKIHSGCFASGGNSCDHIEETGAISDLNRSTYSLQGPGNHMARSMKKALSTVPIIYWGYNDYTYPENFCVDCSPTVQEPKPDIPQGPRQAQGLKIEPKADEPKADGATSETTDDGATPEQQQIFDAAMQTLKDGDFWSTVEGLDKLLEVNAPTKLVITLLQKIVEAAENPLTNNPFYSPRSTAYEKFIDLAIKLGDITTLKVAAKSWMENYPTASLESLMKIGKSLYANKEYGLAAKAFEIAKSIPQEDDCPTPKCPPKDPKTIPSVWYIMSLINMVPNEINPETVWGKIDTLPKTYRNAIASWATYQFEIKDNKLNGQLIKQMETLLIYLDRNAVIQIMSMAKKGGPLTMNGVQTLFETFLVPYFLKIKSIIKIDSDYSEKSLNNTIVYSRLLSALGTYASIFYRSEMGTTTIPLEMLCKACKLRSKDLFNEYRKIIRYLWNAHLKVSLPSEKEAEALHNAQETALSCLELFTNAPDIKYYCAMTIMMQPEDLEKRRLAKNMIEEIFEFGVIPEDLEKDLILARGLVWREYLEALIHSDKSNEKEIKEIHQKSDEYLIDAMNKYPDDFDAKLNYEWSLYNWGKYTEDFEPAIKEGGQFLAQAKKYMDDASRKEREKLENQVGELSRVYGWSLIKSAAVLVKEYKTNKKALNLALAARRLMEGKEIIKNALPEMETRLEKRDALYGLAQTNLQLTMIYSFQDSPEDVRKLNPLGLIEEGLDYLEQMELEQLEPNLHELYYAKAYFQKELEKLGSIRTFFANPLSHAFALPGTYYTTKILPFLDKLGINEVDSEHQPIEYDINIVAQMPYTAKAEVLKEYADSFNAIELYFTALLLGTEKREKTRIQLIDCLRRQNQKDIPTSYKEDNLLLIILLHTHNIEERKFNVDPAMLGALADDLEAALKQWELLSKDEREAKKPALKEIEAAIKTTLEQIGPLNIPEIERLKSLYEATRNNVAY